MFSISCLNSSACSGRHLFSIKLWERYLTFFLVL